MADKIEKIVERTMRYTRRILDDDPARWPVARQGIEAMLKNLEERSPDHPALARLRRFCGRLQEDYDLER